MKEQWTDDIRDGMKDFKAEVPEGLLDDIKKEMKQREVVPPPMVVEKRNISRILVYTTMAAAAMLLLLFILQPKVQDSNVVYLTKSNTPSTTIRKDRIEPLLAIDETPKMTEQHQVSGKNIAKKTNDVTPKSYSEIEENIAVATENKKNTTVKKEEETKDNKPQKENPTNWTFIDTVERIPIKNHSTVSLVASINGSSGSMSGSQGIMLAMAEPYGESANLMDGRTLASRLVETNAVQKSVNHHQPIKVGLSLRYPICFRWSLTAGITYSKLMSDFEYYNNVSEYTTKQSLHYIGIPVAASYSIFFNKNINIYLTGGFAMEKLVSGKAVNVYDNSTTESNSVKESRPQFSVNSAIGAEYLITNGISAFAEPGFSYYFDNGSSITNIYKDRPANISFNFGLRFNLAK